MRFLLDQDVYEATARFLLIQGHEIVRASQIGMSQAPDIVILSTAAEDNRILVTRDRDFGSLVFARRLGTGVVYLRILPSTADAIHRQLAKVLQTYSEEELKRAFVVVEPDGHRMRRLSQT